MKPILTLEQIAERVSRCTRCGLHENRRCAVPGVIGNERTRHIVFIGEAPGFEEDVKGEPFVGASGRKLTAAVRECCGMERGEYTILNSVKCRPPENRDPTTREKQICRPFLMGQLANIGTCLIITLGKHAAHTILSEDHKMDTLRSNYYVDKEHTIIVVPTFHPAATMYQPKWKAAFYEDLRSLVNGKFLMLRSRERCHINIDGQEGIEGSESIL